MFVIFNKAMPIFFLALEGRCFRFVFKQGPTSFNFEVLNRNFEVNQAGLKPTELCLPLSAEAWVKVCATKPDAINIFKQLQF